MKKTFVFSSALLLTVMLLGQTNSTVTIPNTAVATSQNTRFYLSAGGGFYSFQDAKFSNLILGGTGVSVALGRSKSTSERFTDFGLNVNVATLTTDNFSQSATITNPQLYYRYLHAVNDRLQVGARWDILDFYLRSWNELGNNKTYDLQASTLNAAVRYAMPIKDRHIIYVGLDLGLLSFNREGTSFAFSAPQNVLEEGQFNYQEEAQSSPFGFKYYEFETINEYLNLRTSIAYDLHPRFRLEYNWHLRHSTEVKGYALTTAQHTLRVQYNIINR